MNQRKNEGENKKNAYVINTVVLARFIWCVCIF